MYNYVTLEIKAILLTCTVAWESMEDVTLLHLNTKHGVQWNLHSMLSIQMTNIEEWQRKFQYQSCFPWIDKASSRYLEKHIRLLYPVINIHQQLYWTGMGLANTSDCPGHIDCMLRALYVKHIDHPLFNIDAAFIIRVSKQLKWKTTFLFSYIFLFNVRIFWDTCLSSKLPQIECSFLSQFQQGQCAAATAVCLGWNCHLNLCCPCLLIISACRLSTRF